MLGLKIRGSELGITAALAGYFFLIVSTHYLIKPARNALFIEDLGADQLPWVYIGTALVTWVVMAAYVRYAPRRRLMTLLRATLLLLSSNLVAFWLLIDVAGEWLQAVLYIWVKVYAVLLPSQFWLLADELLDPRQAKRLFGPVGSGGILGSVAGSGMAWAFAEPLDTTGLLLAAAGVLLAALAVLSAIERTSQGRLVLRRVAGRPLEPPGAIDTLAGAEVGRPPDRAPERRPGDRLGASRRLVLMIAAVLTLAIIVHTLIDWQFNKVIEQEVGDLDMKTAFFGRFFTLLNLVTLVIQLLVTSVVLRWFGVGVALLLLPIAMATGAIGILLHPGLWTATLARGADDALRYSVDQSARELLFLPVPSALRLQLKPRIDLVASRAANGIAGVVILAVLALANEPLPTLSVVSLAAIAVWILIAVRARDHYAGTLQRLLKVRDVDVTHLARSRLDANAHEAIRNGLGSDDAATVQAALALAEHTDPGEFIGELRLLLRDSRDPELRARVLHLLAEVGDQSAVDEAIGFLDQPDRDLTAEALAYACAAGDPQAEAQIEAYLEGEDPLLAVSAAVCLLEHGDPDQQQRGATILDRAARFRGRDGAAVRSSVADVLRNQPLMPALHDTLLALLGDAESEVVRSALAAAARHWEPALVQTIARAGLRRTLRAPALQALRSIGADATGPLTGLLADPRNTRPLRQFAARSLSRIGGPAAVQSLMAGLAAEDRSVRYSTLKALNYMRRRGQEVEIGESGEAAVIDTEWREFLSFHRFAAPAGTAPGGGALSFLAEVVRERQGEALERLFRALALRHPVQTIFFAYQGLVAGEPSTRAHAIELVDSTVEGPLRRPLVKILEEDDVRRRAELAATELGLAVPGIAAALRELVTPGDPWLAACAVAAMEDPGDALPEGLRKELEATGYPPLLEQLAAARLQATAETRSRP